MKIHDLLFILTISLGSFLLFQVQPMISKYILPWFGGSSSVWITAMLFFQSMLLAGYAYIFLLRRFSLKKQLIFHLIFILLISGILICLSRYWEAPIFPSKDWQVSNMFDPSLQILWILALGVGLPYLLPATTSIVLQKWFSAIHDGASPYLFYAFSNAASLVGIVSYPFLIEPYLSLKNQGLGWSFLFLLYAIFLFGSCLVLFYLSSKYKTKKKTAQLVSYTSVTKKKYYLWFVLSFTATLMLLAITNVLTQAIAPVPFLWLLPLALYLISFILCFMGARWYHRTGYAYLFLLSMPFAFLFSVIGAPHTIVGAIIFGIVLFSICMLCHGELYAFRPHPRSLDVFYTIIALGGAMAGIFVGLIAPLVFRGMWELYFAFYASFLIAVAVIIHYQNSRLYFLSRNYITSQKEAYLLCIIGFPVVLFATTVFILWRQGTTEINQWRNFYGVLTVEKRKDESGSYSLLQHGNIIHGLQYSSEPLRYEPTSYYSSESGLGRIFAIYPREGQPLHVGVVGLGVGTIAAYAEKGDHYRFYDINPLVLELAQNEFTYLKDSPAQMSLVLGDGRLSLEQEVEKKEPPFDVLVLDAFSSDAIPVHLLTKEAFVIYLERLVSDGVLLIHISNNHLDLKPPLVSLAKYYDLSYAFLYDAGGKDALPSEWAVFTKNDSLLAHSSLKKMQEADPQKTSALWTDDYSNLLHVIK